VVEPSTSVVCTGAGAATDKVSATVAVCCGEPLSVAVTPKEKVPLAVGVPEIAPVEAAKDMPAGSEPELILQVLAGVPPVAARLALYGVPKTPEGIEVVEIARLAAVVPDEAIMTFIDDDC
jgi:hypothetical protein